MATDFDELRSDVKELQDSSLAEVQFAKDPDALSSVRELDEIEDLAEGRGP